MIEPAGSEVVRTIEGRNYAFRIPSLYDTPKIRRILTRQRVRRPSAIEFKIAALAGIRGMAEAVGDPEEGERQCTLIEAWYAYLEPVREADIDEPDPMKRGEELVRREEERIGYLAAMRADIVAIEANLERHHQPYAELLADRTFFDDVSRIEAVRLLLVSVDGAKLARDDDDMLAPSEYEKLPREHRVPLATAAYGLLAPDETQRKN